MRYAGKGATDNENNKKLLHALRHLSAANRNAYFYCVLVLLQYANDPTPLICEGIWHGRILKAPQGNFGFGYDPIFYVPTEKKSVAEISLTVKNRISHRGKALRLLIKKIAEKL